jgi:hypothetical protein
MSVPAPVVELFLGGSWVDVSGWVDLGDDGGSLTITRGRDNEQSDPSAGTCSFALVNDDGRFTLGNLSGAYSPNFKLWVQVRVTVAGVREFTGYVSQAVTTWDDDTGLHSHTAITCTDVIGMMAMSPVVTSWAEALIGSFSPLYWWKMSDGDGSTQAVEVSGNPSLVGTLKAGTEAIGDHLTFGVEGPPSLETSTQMSWDNTAAQSWNVQLGGLAGIGTTFTILCIYTPNIKPTNATDQILSLTKGTTVINIYRAAAATQFEQWVGASSDGSIFFNTPRAYDGVPVVLALVAKPGYLVVPGVTPVVRLNSTDMNGGTIQVGGVLSGDPGTAGTISNLAIINREITAAEYADLSLKTLGGTGPVVDWLNRASSEAGCAPSVAATYNRTMERPLLKDSNPAELGNGLANSAASLFVADKSGVPTWYDFSYCPARIVIATGEWDRDTEWAPDSSLYYSEVQFDSVVAGTVAGAFPRRPLDLPGLLPATDEASLARWFVNAQDVITGPRLSTLTIDMLAAATPATYQAIDLRSRINLQSAPAQVPLASVMTVEGYTTTISKDSWVLQLTTAPDPRFVLADTIAGVLASNYRVCPLG